MTKMLARGRRGFTLVELMVVMAILGLLSAIVVPAVTGVSTVGRQTGQAGDMHQLANAVQTFNSEDSDGSPWPTLVALAGGGGDVAGTLPSGEAAGTGATSSDPLVFENDDILGIDWASSATDTSGGTKLFYPDYLETLPRHSADVIALAANSASETDDSSDVFEVKRGGTVMYVQFHNKHTAAVNFPVWVLDKDGKAWVFVNADLY